MNKKTSKKVSKSNAKRLKKPVTKPTTKATKSSQKTRKPTKKSVKTAKAPKAAPKFASKYPRAEGNPYRVGSSYGIAFDILSANADGMPRQALIEELAAVTGKPVKNCGFDVSVITSPTASGKRHSSCRGTYAVEKTNEHVKLRQG